MSGTGDKPQEQAPDMSKLDAIGRLAGGIAHEFNNLLTIITGYSCVLLESHGPGDPDHEALAHIQAASQRAAVLVRQLLAVGGRQMLRPRWVDLNALVAGLADVCKRLLGPSIHLHLNLDPSLPSIHVDPEPIEQVMIDLVVNAREAMPAGGHLTLSTGSTADGKAGWAVRLTVSDTGRGMDARTLSQVFEPFFTTKEVGQGTGLSLAAAYGIVKQCGGRLSAASQPGQGSTFTLLLPAVAPEHG